ncbi:serine/threonine-protein kinase Doa-like [Paramacrobiotus metropolitanus]|uniref:serine/threonine-protein kinase Doa-like n=1 Tax=Paramacrobiotus metropolitanus TaxID=2943436 RepID=UPI002445FD1F|nr:serine/threonine-protein kinase Doa-like [Paramacrobiotus metropolitanus]
MPPGKRTREASPASYADQNLFPSATSTISGGSDAKKNKKPRHTLSSDIISSAPAKTRPVQGNKSRLTDSSQQTADCPCGNCYLPVAYEVSKTSAASCTTCSSNPYHSDYTVGCKPTHHYLSPHRLAVNRDSHLVISPNDVLKKRYHVLKILGKGTFGRVYCVRDMKSATMKEKQLALKITQCTDDAQQDAEYEINVLKELLKLDPEARHLFVRMFDSFTYHGHPCMVMEKLGCSLYTFLQSNDYQPFPFDQLRIVAYQLCYAVNFLHVNNIIHTDLKTDNVVLAVEPREIFRGEKVQSLKSLESTDIRIIDFGSAIFEHEYHGTSVTTRQYRAPEITLQLGWSYPIDVWSVGMILFELYTGTSMFERARNTRVQLAMMERVLGKIPGDMYRRGEKKTVYAKNGRLSYDKRCSEWQEHRRYCKPLADCMRDQNLDTVQFFDLLSNMLRFEQDERITLQQALDHKYFSALRPVQKLHMREKLQRGRK